MFICKYNRNILAKQKPYFTILESSNINQIYFLNSIPKLKLFNIYESNFILNNCARENRYDVSAICLFQNVVYLKHCENVNPHYVYATCPLC